MPCTTVTNFCSKGKVMLLPSMVRYQVLLCVRHTRYMDPIAMNKLCKLNLWYFTMYLAINQQQGYQGFFEYCVYFFQDFSLLIFDSIIS